MEFNYNCNYFLLTFYQTFYLWKYNSKINQIEKYYLENQIIDNKQIFNYGPLLYEESKKLLIIQCFYPKSIIEFYYLIEDNINQLAFKKIEKYIEFSKDDNLVKGNNNYFIFKNKYLLLCTGKRKNNFSAGVYIIDLEDFEKINFIKFHSYISINSLISTKNNNIIIASSIFHYKNLYCTKEIDVNKNKRKVINITRGRILSIEIKEENKNVFLYIKKYLEGGEFYYINCPKLFSDEYFFTSICKNNRLIKLNDDASFDQYFKIDY